MEHWSFKIRIKGTNGEIELQQVLQDTVNNKQVVRQECFEKALDAYKKLGE